MDFAIRPETILSLTEDEFFAVASSINRLGRRVRPKDRLRIRDFIVPSNVRWTAQDEPDAIRDALLSLGPAWVVPTIQLLAEASLLAVDDEAVGPAARHQLQADAVISGSDLGDAALTDLLRVLRRAVALVAEEYVRFKLYEYAAALRRSWFIDVRLAAVRQAADALATATAPAVGGRPPRPTLSAAADRLRNQVREKHCEIEPPDLDKRRKVAIDELYTPQLLNPDDGFATGYVVPITTPQFVDGLWRAVVLGTPGGGKSTLAHYACHELAKHSWSPNVRRPIPLFVQLRKWRPGERSVVEQLYATANTTYQAPLPEGYLEALLGAGLVLPVFDGLDEVLDLEGRREAVAAIKQFGASYPATPILVSARRIGYEQAALPPEDFDAMVLAEFGVEQVEEYCGRWFKFGAELTDEEATATAAAFRAESKSVDDIRRNPLLLSLMCILYRGHRYIPQNRPQLYAQCARLLFVDWDEHRKINMNLPFGSLVDECVQHLAHWIFGDEERERGVPEQRLVMQAQEYFADRLYDDPGKARAAAEDFVAFCRGRAWILSATGTAAGTPNVFQFTHRTFLEHFTGTFLARTAESPGALAVVLAEHIGDPQWEVVSQVAIYRQKEDRFGAADAIIGELLDAAEVRGAMWTWQAVAFLVRCLAIVVPKPAVVGRLVWKCLDLDAEAMAGRRADDDDDALISLVLDDALAENAESIKATFGRWLEARLTEAEGVSLATVLTATIAARSIGSGPGILTATVARWQPLLRAEVRNRAADREQAINFVRSGLLDPAVLFELHGIDGLFVAYRDTQGFWQPGLGSRIVIELLGGLLPPGQISREASISVMFQVAGEIMAGGSRTVTIGPSATLQFEVMAGWSPGIVDVDPLDMQWTAGLVLFCCLWEEAATIVGVEGPRSLLREFALAGLDGLKDVLERRSDEAWSVDGLRSIGFPPDVERFILDWAEHRIDLVASAIRVDDLSDAPGL